MKRNLVLFVSLFIPLQVFAIDLNREYIQVDGKKRSFYITDNVNSEPLKKQALLISLHGGDRKNGDETADRTGFHKLAYQEKFVAVFPNGFKGKWHDGRLPKRKQKQYLAKQENDIHFIKMLVQHLIKEKGIDEKRVYITGLSNGGMMSFRMACEAGELFAAVAPVIANMPEDIVADCKPKAPVSMLLMNGTSDPLVPWQGGEVKAAFKDRGKVLSTQESFSFWLDKNSCNKKAATERYLEDKNTEDDSKIYLSNFSCENNIEMSLVRIEGGGHTLPGSNIPNRPRLLGTKNMDINGADFIWRFLKTQTR